MRLCALRACARFSAPAHACARPRHCMPRVLCVPWCVVCGAVQRCAPGLRCVPGCSWCVSCVPVRCCAPVRALVVCVYAVRPGCCGACRAALPLLPPPLVHPVQYLAAPWCILALLASRSAPSALPGPRVTRHRSDPRSLLCWRPACRSALC